MSYSHSVCSAGEAELPRRVGQQHLTIAETCQLIVGLLRVFLHPCVCVLVAVRAWVRACALRHACPGARACFDTGARLLPQPRVMTPRERARVCSHPRVCPRAGMHVHMRLNIRGCLSACASCASLPVRGLCVASAGLAVLAVLAVLAGLAGALCALSGACALVCLLVCVPV